MKLRSRPILLGFLMAFPIFGAIIVMDTWFPGLGEALGEHRRLSEAVFFTVALFGVCVYYFWNWQLRSRGVFWTSMGIFFLLHALGVLVYSTRIGPILVWQWAILLYVECYLAALFVGWSTHKFSHTHTKS